MKKIPYEYILHFLQLTLVSLFVLVLLAFNLDIKATNFLQRGMISQNALGFELLHVDGSEQISMILSNPSTVIFKDLVDLPRHIVRGYYGRNDIFGFSEWIEEGRFFETNDFEIVVPQAVIGYHQLQEIIEENGHSYIGFDQNRYKVIGVFRETGTDLDHVIYLNLSYILENQSPNGRYFVDGQNESQVEDAMFAIESGTNNNFLINSFLYRDGHEFIMAPFQEMILMIGLVAANANLIMTTISFTSRQKYKVAIQKLCGMTKKDLSIIYLKHLLTINLLAILTVWVTQTLLGQNQESILYLERLSWQHYGVMILCMFSISLVATYVVVKSADGVNISDTLKGV